MTATPRLKLLKPGTGPYRLTACHRNYCSLQFIPSKPNSDLTQFDTKCINKIVITDNIPIFASKCRENCFRTRSKPFAICAAPIVYS